MLTQQRVTNWLERVTQRPSTMWTTSLFLLIMWNHLRFPPLRNAYPMSEHYQSSFHKMFYSINSIHVHVPSWGLVLLQQSSSLCEHGEPNAIRYKITHMISIHKNLLPLIWKSYIRAATRDTATSCPYTKYSPDSVYFYTMTQHPTIRYSRSSTSLWCNL